MQISKAGLTKLRFRVQVERLLEAHSVAVSCNSDLFDASAVLCDHWPL